MGVQCLLKCIFLRLLFRALVIVGGLFSPFNLAVSDKDKGYKKFNTSI